LAGLAYRSLLEIIMLRDKMKMFIQTVMGLIIGGTIAYFLLVGPSIVATDRGKKCRDLNGVWLPDYGMCFKQEAIIPVK
jgi:hypothetical protein